MKNSHTSSILTIFLLVLMCGGIITSVYYYYELQKSRSAIEDTVNRLNQANEKNKMLTNTIARIVADLDKNDSITQAQSHQNAPIHSHTPAPLVKTDIIKAKKALSDVVIRAQGIENSVFDVAIYSYNCSADISRKAADYFTQQGYTAIHTYTLDTKPSWFAANPTVFYYSNKNSRKAAALARDLSKVTGLSFQEKGGAGFGVTRGTEDYTIKVHLILANTPQKQYNTDQTAPARN